MANLFLQTQPLIPIPSGSNDYARLARRGREETAGNGVTFAGVLNAARKKVSFSRHAIERLESRSLDISNQDLTRLDDTVEKMAQKGAKESLIYMNDIALVVSVANRTVITAMDGTSARDNIFTNIDSAAII